MRSTIRLYLQQICMRCYTYVVITCMHKVLRIPLISHVRSLRLLHDSFICYTVNHGCMPFFVVKVTCCPGTHQ